jgi:hypothetical protein
MRREERKAPWWKQWGSTTSGYAEGETSPEDAQGIADPGGGGAMRRWSATMGSGSERRQTRVGKKGKEFGDGKRKPLIYY